MKSTTSKNAKPKLNVKLLRKIQKHILAKPDRLMMEGYVYYGEQGEVFRGDNGSYQRFADCGTAACIAGWTNLLTRGRDATDSERARWLLGSPGSDIDHVNGLDPLFDVNGWPEKFREQYKKRKTPVARAKIAAGRIEHLIETGE